MVKDGQKEGNVLGVELLRTGSNLQEDESKKKGKQFILVILRNG